MGYSVFVTDQAQRNLQTILENDHLYEPHERLQYVEALSLRLNSLANFPSRFQEITINRQTYHAFTFKAHRVFYQINNDTKHVFVLAILASRQDFQQYL